MKSSFQFRSFKIDHIDYKMKPDLGVLSFQGCFDPSWIGIGIGIRRPVYNKSEKIYIGGMDVSFGVRSPDDAVQEEEVAKNELLQVRIGIAGIFFVADDRLEAGVEENLVKIHIPALLFPYVRSMFSSLLSNAGFGSFVLPLINIHEIAKKNLEDLEIEIVE